MPPVEKNWAWYLRVSRACRTVKFHPPNFAARKMPGFEDPAKYLPRCVRLSPISSADQPGGCHRASLFTAPLGVAVFGETKILINNFHQHGDGQVFCHSVLWAAA